MSNKKERIGKIFFGIALILFVLYQIITFVPGAERDAFIFLCCILIIPIVFSKNKFICIISFVLLVVSLFGVYSGYKRGKEYKKFLEKVKRQVKRDRHLFLKMSNVQSSELEDNANKQYIDRNTDGIIDLILTEDKGVLMRKDIDFDFDGKFDKTYIYVNGRIAKIMVDPMGTGIPQETEEETVAIKNDEDVWNEVISAIKENIKNSPKNDIFYLKLGKIYQEQGKWQDAFTNYEKAYELNNGNYDALYGIAEYRKEYGDIENAITIYKKIVYNKKNFTEAYNKLGDLYCDKKMYKESIKSYKKALAINPKSNNARLGITVVYSKMKKLEKISKGTKMSNADIY